jgi:hypothetical protein
VLLTFNFRPDPAGAPNGSPPQHPAVAKPLLLSDREACGTLAHMYPTELFVCRSLTILLSATLFAFLAGRFKELTKRYNAPAIWALYWLFVAAQYLMSVVATATNTRDAYLSQLGRALADIAQSTSLLLIAQTLPRRASQDTRRLRDGPQVATIIFLVAGLVAGAAVANPRQHTVFDYSDSALACIALFWLALRWIAFTSPSRRRYLGLFLPLYAFDYIYALLRQPPEGSIGAVTSDAMLWLVFLVIAYMCVYTLAAERSQETRRSAEPPSRYLSGQLILSQQRQSRSWKETLPTACPAGPLQTRSPVRQRVRRWKRSSRPKATSS